MDHLRRGLAPIPEAAWAQLEEEAQRTLKLSLGARRVVDVTGPIGWDQDAVTTGTADSLAAGPCPGVTAAVRRPLAFVEMAVDFGLSQADLDSAERGNPAIDTNPVITACRRLAVAEGSLMFHGFPEGGVIGMFESSPHEIVSATEDASTYPDLVAHAIQDLRDSGIGGPYSLVVGDSAYTAIAQATKHGYPVRQHLAAVLDGGDIVWSQALRGAVVLSMRGGDFELTLGQDLSLGFRDAVDGLVNLYLQESVAFRVLTPEAAVPISLG